MENYNSKRSSRLTDYFKEVKRPLRNVKLHRKFSSQPSYKLSSHNNSYTFQKRSFRSTKPTRPKSSLHSLKTFDHESNLKTDFCDTTSSSRNRYLETGRITDHLKNKRCLSFEEKTAVIKKTKSAEFGNFAARSENIKCDSTNFESVKTSKSFSWDDYFKELCQNNPLDLLNKTSPKHRSQNTKNSITRSKSNFSSSLEMNISINSIDLNELSISTIASDQSNKSNSNISNKSGEFIVKELIIDTVNEFPNEEEMLNRLRRQSSSLENSFLLSSERNNNQNRNVVASEDTSMQVVLDNVNKFKNEQIMLKYLSQPGSTPEKEEYTLSPIVLKSIEAIDSKIVESSNSSKFNTNRLTKHDGNSCKTISKNRCSQLTLDDFLRNRPISHTKKESVTIDNINTFKNEEKMLKFLFEQGCTPEKKEHSFNPILCDYIQNTVTANKTIFENTSQMSSDNHFEINKSFEITRKVKDYVEQDCTSNKKEYGFAKKQAEHFSNSSSSNSKQFYIFNSENTDDSKDSVMFTPEVFQKRNNGPNPVFQYRKVKPKLTPDVVTNEMSKTRTLRNNMSKVECQFPTISKTSTQSLEQTDFKHSQANKKVFKDLITLSTSANDVNTLDRHIDNNNNNEFPQNCQINSSSLSPKNSKDSDTTIDFDLRHDMLGNVGNNGSSLSPRHSTDSDTTIDLFLLNDMLRNVGKNNVSDTGEVVQKSIENSNLAVFEPLQHISADQNLKSIFDSDNFLTYNEQTTKDVSLEHFREDSSKLTKKNYFTFKSSVGELSKLTTEGCSEYAKRNVSTGQVHNSLEKSELEPNKDYKLDGIHFFIGKERRSSQKQKSDVLTLEHLSAEHILRTMFESNKIEEDLSKDKSSTGSTRGKNEFLILEDEQQVDFENIKKSDYLDKSTTQNSCLKVEEKVVETLESNILYDTNILKLLMEEQINGRENKKSKFPKTSQNSKGNRKLFKKNNFYIKRYKKGKTKIYKLKRRLMVDKAKFRSDEDGIKTFLSQASQNVDSQKLSGNNNEALNESLSSVSTNASYGTYDTEKDVTVALSIASKNSNSPRFLLRKAINRISTDKSLLFAYDEDYIPPDKDVEEIQMRIQQIFDQVLRDFKGNRSPKIVYRRQTLDNCILKNGSLQMKTLEECQLTTVRHGHAKSRMRFNLILFILQKIATLLDTNTKLTKRELYYQLKTVIKSQHIVDRAINTVSCLLDVSMWSLNITAQKGLVFGNLNILLSSGETMNCNVPGTLIPQDVNDIIEIQSSAYFILVVEKESIFHKLLEENLPNRLTRPFVMITGKGFPDLNTQLFLKKLWMIMSVPVFILVDADPDGISIMLNYKYGSVANAHISQYLTIPKAKWLGVFPSEIVSLNITRENLTNRECKKVQSLLEKPYVKENKQLVKELNVLLESKFKAGIEGLLKTETFLSKVYLPTKLFSGNYH